MIYTFHLRTVTEVFAGGADMQSAELRPSAFRGPLRFWFRAMMGKIVGNDLKSSNELEALAFGGTDASSPFILRVAATASFQEAGALITPPVGKAYLGFSLYTRANKQMYLMRGCLPAGKSFALTFRFKRPNPYLQAVVLDSFWLLLNFGGIGSRTRRGFGALNVCPSEEEELSQEQRFFSIISHSSVQEFYNANLARIECSFRSFAEQYKVVPDGSLPGPTEYASFSNWTAKLIINSTQQNDAGNADRWMNQWGILLRSFRNDTRVRLKQSGITQQLQTSTSDYREVASPLMAGRRPRRLFLKNDVFGLPIIFQSRSQTPLTLSWRGPSQKADGRRASPLFLHPILLPDGRYATLVTFFVSRFLPEEAEIPVSQGKALSTASTSNIASAAAAFFEYLETNFRPRPQESGDLFVALP